MDNNFEMGEVQLSRLCLRRVRLLNPLFCTAQSWTVLLVTLESKYLLILGLTSENNLVSNPSPNSGFSDCRWSFNTLISLNPWHRLKFLDQKMRPYPGTIVCSCCLRPQNQYPVSPSGIQRSSGFFFPSLQFHLNNSMLNY